ncbi:TPA: GGDEF domain-containing protein, partial [Enterobacter hormaechei]
NTAHTHRLGFTPAIQPVGAEIIARADAALYRAKEVGRDRWSL